MDVGSKRTGLAVTDTLRLIASALATVDTRELVPYLKRYLAAEVVDGFVVGLPMGLDAQATDGTAHAQAQARQLEQHFPGTWVELVDERYTSRLAQATLLASGKRRMARRDKGVLDRVSATILLQDWLRRQERAPDLR
jgi:putative holliday junction resolvase